jgi:hypothetical protein
MAVRDDVTLEPARPLESEEQARACRYRTRAREIRAIAEGMVDPECRNVLYYLARSYEGMAERAETAIHPTGPAAGEPAKAEP